MLTCFGKLSRNMTFGLKLAEGIKKEDIIKESKGVVEGLPTLKVVVEYCRERKVYLPIIETIY
jgi:glycerol-3-phosphate dehydrogenase